MTNTSEVAPKKANCETLVSVSIWGSIALTMYWNPPTSVSVKV